MEDEINLRDQVAFPARQQPAAITSGGGLNEIQVTAKQVPLDLLRQSVDTLKAGYQALAQKLEEDIADSSRLAEADVVLVLSTMTPLAPVKSQKMLNAALTGVFGMMTSTFLVFFLEFWRKTAPTGVEGCKALPSA